MLYRMSLEARDFIYYENDDELALLFLQGDLSMQSDCITYVDGKTNSVVQISCSSGDKLLERSFLSYELCSSNEQDLFNAIKENFQPGVSNEI